MGIEGGGDVEVLDLGAAVVILPGDPGSSRRALARVLNAERYDEMVAGMDDPDLRDV